MARLAIFIDKGYLDPIAMQAQVWVDYPKFSIEIHRRIKESTNEPLDLLRTYVYDCMPFRSNPPTEDEEKRYRDMQRFISFLEKQSRYTVRLGSLKYRGRDAQGKPYLSTERGGPANRVGRCPVIHHAPSQPYGYPQR